MADARDRGGPDRSPRPGGERQAAEGDGAERRDRHLRVGVSHPSNDPARHRVFEIRAAYDGAAGGWVARVGEQDLNEQLGGWGPAPSDGGRARAFPTPAACLGDAVAWVVAAVDREADDRP